MRLSTVVLMLVTVLEILVTEGVEEDESTMPNAFCHARISDGSVIFEAFLFAFPSTAVFNSPTIVPIVLVEAV